MTTSRWEGGNGVTKAWRVWVAYCLLLGPAAISCGTDPRPEPPAPTIVGSTGGQGSHMGGESGDGDGDGDGGNEGPTLPPAPKQFGVPSPGGRYLWSDPALLPPLPGQKDLIGAALRGRRGRGARKMQREGAAFRVRHRGSPPQPWEAEADDDRTGTPYANGGAGGTGEGGGEGGGHVNHGRGITGGSSPRVDYTSLEYRYPDVLREPPAGGGIRSSRHWGP